MQLKPCCIKPRILLKTCFRSWFSEHIPYLRFAFCAVIDGIQYKTGIGSTKKEARHSAAELALQEFLPTLEGGSHHDAQGLFGDSV